MAGMHSMTLWSLSDEREMLRKGVRFSGIVKWLLDALQGGRLLPYTLWGRITEILPPEE